MADSKLSTEEINLALGKGGCHFQQDLGEGSFGKVVRAITHQVTPQGHYAIKMMICDEERIKYQKRELDLLMELELSAPNIIQYFNSWVFVAGNKEILCIQMELCGWDLCKLLRRNPLSVKERCFYQHIFPQILNGLDAIHHIGWVHRDIHLSNILIANPIPRRTQDIVIKIADFGLAKHIGPSASMKFSTRSTLDKLSPPVGNSIFSAAEMSGDIYDNKVDLYSAGIVLYMLSCYLEAVLKVTTVKQWEAMWKEEISALRNRERSASNLCHPEDQLLIKLIDDLLKQDPAERPSARDALERFSVTGEADGVNAAASSPTSRTKFLVKKEDDENYNRCSCPVEDQSLAGLKEAIQTCQTIGIAKENQLIRQEICEPNGEKIIVYVTSDANVKEMFQSAEEAKCKVKLIVSNKDQPGAEIPGTMLQYRSSGTLD